MITIYLGDVGSYLHRLACSTDPSARLITQDNMHGLEPGSYYTSIGDLENLVNLATVLRQANKIVYAPPQHWSDESNKVSQMQRWTEDYLNVFKFHCKVENYNTVPVFNNILRLEDVRKAEDPQLWIAGCSISLGTGVTTDTRYGQLLANRLDIQASFLTSGGSSIDWAADQIIRSDIRQNDIVVWGLTSHPRLVRFENNLFRHLKPSSPKLDRYAVDLFVSDHIIYQSVISVYQVINFCQRAKAHLIIASVFDDVVVNYIRDFPNLIMLCNLWGRNPQDRFLDIGSDGEHPGIKTHEFYADKIYQKIQESLAAT